MVEITWLTFLLHDISIPLHQPPQLFCDNPSALHMTNNPVFNAWSKYIEIDYHFVEKKVALEALITWFLPSTKQIDNVIKKNNWQNNPSFSFVQACSSLHSTLQLKRG